MTERAISDAIAAEHEQMRRCQHHQRRALALAAYGTLLFAATAIWNLTDSVAAWRWIPCGVIAGGTVFALSIVADYTKLIRKAVDRARAYRRMMQ